MRRSSRVVCLVLGVVTAAGSGSAAAVPHPVSARSGADPQLISRARGASPEAAALCRRSSSEYELGRTSATAGERAVHYRRAEEFAQQAVRVDPQGDEGYKWLAIALGAQTEDASVRNQIQLSRRVKENIDRALALDPNDDISLLVLSRWHYKVASLAPWTRAIVRVVYGGLPPASLEKSAELLVRAIGLRDRIVHRYSLAKVYYQMGRREAALQQLRIALKLPVTIPEETEDLEKARRKLASWK